MRQEDLIKFYKDKKDLMLPSEQKQFMKKLLGHKATDFPAGNEFLVEKKGGKLKFLNFE